MKERGRGEMMENCDGYTVYRFFRGHKLMFLTCTGTLEEARDIGWKCVKYYPMQASVLIMNENVPIESLLWDGRTITYRGIDEEEALRRREKTTGGE